MKFSRRSFLVSSASVLALEGCGFGRAGSDAASRPAPLPLGDIQLTPSVFCRAVAANTRMLLQLEPDRLLHNFRAFAGLDPKGEVYGGWEARGIAGHSLGHYLSALSMTAARGDEEARGRVRYILAELAAVQDAHGDGYIGGTTVERDGEVVSGKIIFEEIRRGDIRTTGFDINGGWVPLYTWHKVQAGLIDAYRLAGEKAARPVLLGMAGYLADILDAIDHGQMQKLLAAEHGGLNEAYADLYDLTGEDRWLLLAERLRHEAVLDPLAAGQDNLAGLHANTQIPKVIGLARLYEVTGKDGYAETARYFYHTVVDDHSYVIGGNSEREHFRGPDVIAGALSDRTCEACNSYNVLKLTGRLWAWDQDAALFEDYERTYINHILAHQHPETGMFVYFMPLESGSRRTYSTLDDSFWCCVGSGMESHAKHGDLAFWGQGRDTLYVNLFVPAGVTWKDGGMKLNLATDYPRGDRAALLIEEAPDAQRTLAIRLPGWCSSPRVTVNDEAVEVSPGPGYARLTRQWRQGDRVEIHTPMRVIAEAAPDDENVIAFVQGPLVLAADLGPAENREALMPPALISADAANSLEQMAGDPFAHRLTATAPSAVTLRPFYDMYDRRTAVYFPRFTPEEWAMKEADFRAEQQAMRALAAQTIDVIYLGEMQPERDHNFRTNQSDVIAIGGRNGRTAWWGVDNFIEFDLSVSDGPVVLRALYWGEDTGKEFNILVEGELISREVRDAPPEAKFIAVDYPLSAALTEGKNKVTVRFNTLGTDAPVYEVRTLRA